MSRKHRDLAWRLEGLTQAQKLICLHLADRADESGKCWPGISDTVRRTGLSRSTVIDNQAKLEALGVLKKQRRGGNGGGARSNIYELTFELYLGAKSGSRTSKVREPDIGAKSGSRTPKVREPDPQSPGAGHRGKVQQPDYQSPGAGQQSPGAGPESFNNPQKNQQQQQGNELTHELIEIARGANDRLTDDDIRRAWTKFLLHKRAKQPNRRFQWASWCSVEIPSAERRGRNNGNRALTESEKLSRNIREHIG